MYQYTRCYGLTRIPQHGCDALNHVEFPSRSKHIVVTAKNQYYSLTCYDTDGNILSDGDIEKWLLLVAISYIIYSFISLNLFMYTFLKILLKTNLGNN